MVLELRKYNFIQEIFGIEKESVMDALEKTLKEKVEAEHVVSEDHKKLLDQRMNDYKENPEDLLDWDTERHKW